MLSQAQVVRVRSALEKGYIGAMDVYGYAEVTDSTTHITSVSESQLYTGIPCRLSFSSSPQNSDGDAPATSQVVKVFYSPEYSIPSGSKLVIAQNGVTSTYRHSGQEAVYDTHREAILELSDRWA